MSRYSSYQINDTPSRLSLCISHLIKATLIWSKNIIYFRCGTNFLWSVIVGLKISFHIICIYNTVQEVYTHYYYEPRTDAWVSKG